jgi:hypothetical protein
MTTTRNESFEEARDLFEVLFHRAPPSGSLVLWQPRGEQTWRIPTTELDAAAQFAIEHGAPEDIYAARCVLTAQLMGAAMVSVSWVGSVGSSLMSTQLRDCTRPPAFRKPYHAALAPGPVSHRVDREAHIRRCPLLKQKRRSGRDYWRYRSASIKSAKTGDV